MTVWPVGIACLGGDLGEPRVLVDRGERLGRGDGHRCVRRRDWAKCASGAGPGTLVDGAHAGDLGVK